MHRYYSTYFYTIYAALIVLVPTIMSSKTSELFEFNKMLVIYLGAGFVLAGLIWKWMRAGTISILLTPYSIAFIVFLGTQLLSTVFSIDVQTSLFGYYGRFLGGVSSWFALGILAIGLHDWLSSEEDPSRYMKSLMFWVMGVSILVVGWGLFGTFGHDLTCLVFTGHATNECWSASFRPAERMFSTLGQPNWLGAFLSIAVALTLPYLDAFFAQLVKERRVVLTKKSFFPLIAAICSLLGIYLSGSRSAEVATGVIIGVWLVWKTNHQRIIAKLRTHFKLIVLAKVVSFFVGFVLLFMYVSRDVRVEPSNSATPSSIIRQIVWKGAFDILQSHPLVGTGPETFAYSYYQVRPLVHNLTSEWDYLYNRAHNEFLNIAATSGMLGFLSYSAMFASVFYVGLIALRKTDKELSAQRKHVIYSLFLALISLCITNFFGFATTSISLLMVYISTWVGIEAESYSKEYKLNISKIGSLQALSMASVVAIVTVALVGSYWYADVLYARGRADASTNNYGSAVLAYTKALQIRDEHVYQEALSYSLANLALVTKSSKNTIDDQSYVKTLMSQSSSLIQSALSRSPHNVIYYRTAARIQFANYQVSGLDSDFMSLFGYLDTAKKLAPTEPKNYYTAALFYNLALDDPRLKSHREEFAQMALKEVGNAIEMKKDYRDAYIAQGMIQIKLGDSEGARASYQYILDHINPNDEEAKSALDPIVR